MKLPALIAGAALMSASPTLAQEAEAIGAVSPALARDTRERLQGEVWNRPGLDRRDRSLITLSAVIARGQAGAVGHAVETALDAGVTPVEVSAILAHLAYYSGWGAALSAVEPMRGVFEARGIGADQLVVAASPLPLDQAAEAARAASVGGQFGETAPGLVDYTTDYLFRDLWLRPDLKPRDRSLITVAALISAGQVAQVPYHLNRAMDAGLTQDQAAEVVTHLAFYAGWPNAMSALPVVKQVFADRAEKD